MLSTILKWFGYQKDGSIVINSPTSSATVSGVVTFTGTSIQSVNDTNLPPQSFSVSVDLSAVQGAYTFHAYNSAGHVDDRTVYVQNASPNGTIIYNNEGNHITDSAGDRWTLSAGVVYKNSATIGFSAGITELIYYNGVFTSYYPGPPSSCWYFNGTAWVQGTWPKPVSEFGHLQFWGTNIHHTWVAPYTNWSSMAAKCVEMGFGVLRTGMSSGDVTSLKNFISAYAAPAHLAVYPVFLPNEQADESASYVKGYSLGVEMAALKGYVPVYEICNEKASYSILGGGFNGDVASHYDNTKYLQTRGLLRGIVAGIRSVDISTPLAMGDTWLHYGLTDMLWNGTSPASSGSADTSKIVRWDCMTWHWYDNMGNIEAAGFISANVLSHLAAFSLPIRLNEYGCYASSFSDETAITNYLTGSNLMGKWDSKRATYNIKGAEIYELFDDGSAGDEGKFGVVNNDGTTKKSIRWTAVAAFVSSHP